MTADALAEAARRERDHRAASYPARLAAELPDTPAYAARLAALTVDYQCWCAIAEWLESGRFGGFYGGSDQHECEAPWIGWPQLEDAAAKAVASIEAKIAKLAADADRERVAPALAERQERRAQLTAIHRKVRLRRQMIDSINADLRAARSAAVGNERAAA
jgi:hypothetical protein